MNLELVEVLQGVFSLIFVIISAIVGLKILLKYFQIKKREFLFVGLSWIGIASPWYPGAINIVLILIFNTSLSIEARFLIGNIIIPIVLILWLFAFTDLTYRDKQKLILIIFTIIVAGYEIIFFYFFFTDLALIGTVLGPFQVRWSYFIRFSMLLFILTALVSGILFARESFKSKNLEIKLKGKFLLLAFISYTFGALLDALIPLSPITVVIIRVILILSAIEFYLGFNLPKSIKNIFLKEE